MGGQRLAVVTGGAGFIGSHLCEALVSAGWRVRAFDDLSRGCAENLADASGVELLCGDVRDARAVARAVAGAEVVFHQAALASVPRSLADPLHSQTVNADGTLQVLEAARRAGVRRVVHASSSAVYGDAKELPLRESLLPAPRSPYALQKQLGEGYCRLYSERYGLEAVALRYFNVFGPRQDPRGDDAAVVPRFVAACLSGQRPVVFGDGEQSRDFVSVADVVRANLRAAEAPGAAGWVCNVGSGRSIRLNELLGQIQRHLGSGLAPEYRAPRADDVRHSRACLRDARERLGFGSEVSLEEGLRRTIAWFEKVRSRQSGGVST